MGATRTSQSFRGDFRRFDPLRSLDWRWSAAQAHMAAGTQTHEWEDPAITTVLAYLRELARAATADDLAKLHRLYPDLSDAHRLFTAAGTLRDEVEARLLCQHVQEIGAKTGLAIGALLCYGEVFYDVLRSLAAMDWLLSSVVRLYDLHQRGVTERDQWKYWALANPLMLELLIADTRGLPEPQIPDRHLLAERMRFSLREFCTPSRDRKAMAAIIEEGCQRFGPLWGCNPTDVRERAALNVNMRTLRMAYGLPARPGKTARPPSRKQSKKSVIQPQPEISHGYR